MKSRVRTALGAITRADTPEPIAAEIAATEQEARAARAESERLAAVAAAELDDHVAEDALRQSRSEDRRRRRAEARIAELREQLATATWQARDRAFRQHQRDIARLAQRLFETMQTAVEANAALARARQAAIAEVGNDISTAPGACLGLPLPDLFARWRGKAEQHLRELAASSLQPPPVPSTPRTYSPDEISRLRPIREGTAALFVHAGIPLNTPAPASAVAAPAPAPPPPAPRPRAALRDPPPGPGERQVHILTQGPISLKDGRQLKMGDKVNLPEAQARQFLANGAGDFVKFDAEPTPEPALATTT